MCGIVGVFAQSQKDLIFIKQLILRSQIRGKHATGVSYIKDYTLHSIVEPLCASDFLEKHWNSIYQDLYLEPTIQLIAHTRYSTSDIEFNQPIYDDQLSICMNGVITQSDPEHWEKEFGVRCRTRNDTEIAHIKLKDGYNPLLLSGETGTSSSMSIATLSPTKGVFVFRNGRRPGWICHTDTMSVVASTRDIIKRAYIDTIKSGHQMSPEYIKSTEPGVIYHLGVDVNRVDSISNINLSDWQGVYDYA